MTARYDLRTVRIRLALLFAAVLTAALMTFGGAVYLAAVAAEAAEEEPEPLKERELEEVRHHLLLALLISTPGALAVAAAGAHLLSRRALRVLGDVVHTANALSVERLEQRIPNDPQAGAEVEGLVNALNAMLERIEHAVGGLRRFTSDAAHELRTPLAILASDIEICLRRPRDIPALRTTLESTLEGLGRMAQLVDVLLTLARSDSGELPVSLKEVDLQALLAQIAEPYYAVAAERQLTLSLLHSEQAESAAPLRLHTDPLLLGRALANLLDNACKFCLPGGRITLRLDHPSDGFSIAITDDGPGLSPTDEARAFERFYRGDAHRGSVDGFGLGLSLTREFLTALGATITLSRSAAGGTQALLRLPDSRGAS